MRSDDWSFPTASERNEETLSEVIKKLDELLFHIRKTRPLTYNEVQQTFKDKVLYPFFNNSKAGGYDYAILQEFILMMENNDFQIVHKQALDKLVDLSMFKEDYNYDYLHGVKDEQ